MNCSYCDTPIPDASRFCMTCGADLSDPEVSTRTRAAVKELFDAIKAAVEGRYSVTDMLGRGGMGAVFLAEDLRLGRTVAIKVLRPELATETSFVGRFEREARIAARLDHPNIIPIYAVEEVNGLHYFVMKYIAGKSLDELLTGEPLPVEHCRQVLWQTACGLGQAHQRGVIHRDVKPSNIMIDGTGRAIITDFGISKALQQDTQYTSTGQMIGTPRYVSPEQAQGIALDGRSDQYSLAVVGYQMLIGRLPLIADSVHALMYKHIYEVPPSAQSVRPEIPADISDAIQRALAKGPDDRFATMEAFATALWPERPVRPGEPTPTVPSFPSLAKLIGRQKPRHRRLAALTAVAVGLAIAFLAGRRTERPMDTGADTALRAVDSTPPPAPAAPPPAEAAPVPARPADSAAQGSSSTPESVSTRDSVPTAAPSLPLPPTKRHRPPRVGTPRPPSSPPTSIAVPAPTPAATTGFVTINAVPYGTVSIDDVEIGDTPIVRRELPPGVHTVRIARPGFRTESVSVTVTAGNEVRLSRSLIKDGL
jgi:serine/threonine protein kinase